MADGRGRLAGPRRACCAALVYAQCRWSAEPGLVRVLCHLRDSVLECHRFRGRTAGWLDGSWATSSCTAMVVDPAGDALEIAASLLIQHRSMGAELKGSLYDALDLCHSSQCSHSITRILYDPRELLDSHLLSVMLLHLHIMHVRAQTTRVATPAYYNMRFNARREHS
jgi:hypothetical protein